MCVCSKNAGDVPGCYGLLLLAHHNLWKVCSLLYCVHQVSEKIHFGIIQFCWFWWNLNQKTKKSHNRYFCLTNCDVYLDIFRCAGSRVLGVPIWDICNPNAGNLTMCGLQTSQISGNHVCAERFFLVSSFRNCFQWPILFSSWFRKNGSCCIQANSLYIQHRCQRHDVWPLWECGRFPGLLYYAAPNDNFIRRSLYHLM